MANRQPQQITVSDANKAVDTIVRTLQNPDGRGGGGIVISEVIKAGSLGHGTAVQGHFDLDLVVYSQSVEGSQILREGFDPLLDMLIQYLERRLPGQLFDKHRTVHSVQFKFENRIDVDMLVSPFWREPSAFYHFLETIIPKDRFTFSVSASKWQVEFFKEQPNQVKEFIRRAKAWRNDVWEKVKDGKPKSYLMSVLVLRAYEIAYRKLQGDTSTSRIATQTTHEVQNIVKNHDTADIYWEKYYNKGQYSSLFPRQLPRIVDPANPSNNLHNTGIAGEGNKKGRDYGEGGGSWSNLVRYIDTLDLTEPVEHTCHTPDVSRLTRHF